MKKWMFFILDIILFALFLVIGITGLLIFPGLLPLVGLNLNSLPKYYLFEVHHWFGLVMVVLASIHLDLHWKWLKTMTRQLLKRKQIQTKTRKKPLFNYGINVGLAVSFIIMFITGIIKFRGFTAWIQINPPVLPLYEISLIHDNVGLLALLFSTIHIVLHLKWIKIT